MIPIYIPYLNKKAKRYITKCIDTNWISSQGAYVEKFEKALAKYHRVRYCIATSGCTSALHLTLKSLNLGKGDEVICPDLTFIAPANMIVLSGAKLKLVDIDSETLTIDPKKIDEIASRLADNMPPGIDALRTDVEKICAQPYKAFSTVWT